MRFHRWVLATLIGLFALSLSTGMAGAAPASAQCGSNVTHQVAPGENLFRISLNYGTTMAAVANANGIGNYALIFAGQTLTIPCASGGSGGAPAPSGTPTGDIDNNGILPIVLAKGSNQTSIPDTVTLNCGKLKPTSPLDGMAYGNNTFYWGGVAGATSYRVNVFSLDASPYQLVASFDTPGTRTQLVGDLSDVGPGFLFYWQVQALFSDVVICTSKNVVEYRQVTPPP